jgi:hypothetical protein
LITLAICAERKGGARERSGAREWRWEKDGDRRKTRRRESSGSQFGIRIEFIFGLEGYPLFVARTIHASLYLFHPEALGSSKRTA